MSASACRRCGKSIVFAIDPNGKWQSLDTTTPVWMQIKHKDGKPHVIRQEKMLVSHISTCAKLKDTDSRIAKPQDEEFLF